MNPKPIEHANTPNLGAPTPALQRARKRAEEMGDRNEHGICGGGEWQR